MRYCPLISIVIPTYNRADLLPLTLKALFCQTYNNYEILVIDDGSTDNTESVLSSMNRPEIKLHKFDHQGACAARNSGIELSKGDITCFVDSDDLVEPCFLQNAVEAFQDPSVQYVSSNSKMTREFIIKGKMVARKEVDIPEQANAIDIALWRNKVPLGTGLFFRTNIFKSKVSWDSRFKIMEELDFFIQLYRIRPNGYRYLPEKSFTYRQRHNSDGTCSNVSYAEIAEAYALFAEKHGDVETLKAQANEYVTRHHEYLALARKEREGKIAPHMFRYFPEYYTPGNHHSQGRSF